MGDRRIKVPPDSDFEAMAYKVPVITRDLTTGKEYSDEVVAAIQRQFENKFLLVRTDTHEVYSPRIIPGGVGRCLNCVVTDDGELVADFGLGSKDSAELLKISDVATWYRVEKNDEGQIDPTTLTLIAFCLIPREMEPEDERAKQWTWSCGCAGTEDPTC